MSPSRSIPRRKSLIGQQVFYPAAGSSNPKKYFKTTTSNQHSLLFTTSDSHSRKSMSPPPALSSYSMRSPAETAYSGYDLSEFPFPPVSPSTELRNFADLQFTPSPLTHRNELYGQESPADYTLRSPEDEAIALSSLISDSIYEDHHNFSSPSKASSSKSPLGQSLFSSHPLESPFFSQAPLSSPQKRHPPLPSPLPHRQASWTEALRRSSAPGTTRRTTKDRSPSQTPYDEINRVTYMPRPPVYQHDEDCLPLFPTRNPSQPAPDYCFPSNNALNLQFTFPGPPLEPPADETDESDKHLEYECFEFQPQPYNPSPGSFAPPTAIAEKELGGHDLDPDFGRRFVITGDIGTGGFGFVCTAVQTGYENQRGVEVAVKFIFKDRVEGNGGLVDGEPREAAVLRYCNHPGIVKFIGLYEDWKFWYLVQELHGSPWEKGHTLEISPSHTTISAPVTPTQLLAENPFDFLADHAPIILATELARSSYLSSSSPLGQYSIPHHIPRGVQDPPHIMRPNMARRASYDLFECVEHKRFSEDEAKYIFKQIVDAVTWMHVRGIYHRDLKDENMVIDHYHTVKIIDFGSSVFESAILPTVYESSDFRGTTNYRPPEVLKGQTFRSGPADVWALGILLCILLTGESPFPDFRWAQAGRMRFKKVDRISLAGMHLVHRMLAVDLWNRATITEVQEHDWFESLEEVLV